MTLNIHSRKRSIRSEEALRDNGCPELLARLFSQRGINKATELDYRLESLLPPNFKGLEEATALLMRAITQKQRITIVADYDCDGATACSLGVEALRLLGADSVRYIVPNRQLHGYGLSPDIVRMAYEEGKPDLLVTVDNGIASLDGVEEAKKLGMQVLITDHHLPGDDLPAADAIVNPNQAGCPFPSKCIAGVGVMFYVMVGLRAALRRRGSFQGQGGPALSSLLDLVALGTIADVVLLDHNNRLLVHQGLQRIRKGYARPGIAAMFYLQKKNTQEATTGDLAFQLGPLLNAAGRLANMDSGIAQLLANDEVTAIRSTLPLLELNRQRKERQKEMVKEAEQLLEGSIADFTEDDAPAGVVLYQPGWHQGLVGILAGRLKDKLHRPVIVFGDAMDGCLRGSGRSPEGVHLRDTLDWMWKRAPHLLTHFGGHASAVGLTLLAKNLDEFRALFLQAVCAMQAPGYLGRTYISDGSLELGFANVTHARLLREQIWGQGFTEPLFDDVFQLKKQAIVGEHHLKMTLLRDGQQFEAIQFNTTEPAPSRLQALYRLALNQYRGLEKVQLIVENMQASPT